MNHIPSLLTITTALTLAAPALLPSAQGRLPKAKEPTIIQPDAPRAGLVTIVEFRPDIEPAKRRIAWKSLAAVPAAERERLLSLIRAVDKANRPRAPHSHEQPVAPPGCMRDDPDLQI